MGIENHTIQAILEHGDLNPVMESKLNSSMFLEVAEKEAFEYILKHWKDYGKTPDTTTLAIKVRGFVAQKGKPKEPLDFFIEEMFNRELFNELTANHKDITEALKKRDPVEARKVMAATVESSMRIGRGDKEVTYREAYSADALNERVARYERIKTLGGIDGIATPWPKLDDVTFGWHEKELILVAGRTGTGKTWILLLAAKAAWEDDKKVLFVTFEMADDVIGRRMDGLITGVPYHELRVGELGMVLEEKYKEEMAKLKGRKGFVIMNGGFASTVSQLEAVIKQTKPDMVFVDGVYMMDDGLKTSEPWKKVQNVADQFMMLKMRAGIPIMISAQFNRNVNMKKLSGGLESVGGADRLAQNSDIVIGLFSNEFCRSKQELVFRMMKMREDSLAAFKLNWNFEAMDFSMKAAIKTKVAHVPGGGGGSGGGGGGKDVLKEEEIDY